LSFCESGEEKFHETNVSSLSSDRSTSTARIGERGEEFRAEGAWAYDQAIAKKDVETGRIYAPG